jgi:hypothetical protein
VSCIIATMRKYLLYVAEHSRPAVPSYCHSRRCLGRSLVCSAAVDEPVQIHIARVCTTYCEPLTVAMQTALGPRPFFSCHNHCFQFNFTCSPVGSILIIGPSSPHNAGCERGSCHALSCLVEKSARARVNMRTKSVLHQAFCFH